MFAPGTVNGRRVVGRAPNGWRRRIAGVFGGGYLVFQRGATSSSLSLGQYRPSLPRGSAVPPDGIDAVHVRDGLPGGAAVDPVSRPGFRHDRSRRIE
jgi:hypothetical protein